MPGLAETLSKPVPVPDESSRPFFDGARRGVLLLRRCCACGTFMSPTGGLGTPRAIQLCDAVTGEVASIGFGDAADHTYTGGLALRGSFVVNPEDERTQT